MNIALDYDLCPQKVVFGWGRRREVGGLARTLGRRAFFIGGLPEDITAPLQREIAESLCAEEIEFVPIATIGTSRRSVMSIAPPTGPRLESRSGRFLPCRGRRGGH